MKKLKLTQLAKKELAKKELHNIRGAKMAPSCGSTNGCGCGCLYEDQGGSTSFDNLGANWDLSISTLE